MSAEESLTPAEQRVRSLLGELRADTPPGGAALTRSVLLTARWQRPVRRAAQGIGFVAGAFAAGAGALLRGRRRR